MNNNKSFVTYEDFSLGLWTGMVGLGALLIASLRRLAVREQESFWSKVDKKLDQRDRVLRKDFNIQLEKLRKSVHDIVDSETKANCSLFQIEDLLRKLEAKIDKK